MIDENFKWYITICPNGSEHIAIKKISDYLKKFEKDDLIQETLVPHTIERTSFKKKHNVSNYVFIKTIPNELVAAAFQAAKIISFMKDSNGDLTIVSDEEIEKIKNNLLNNENNMKAQLKVGEEVVVNQEPFIDFKGVIDAIDYEKQIATVLIKILGRTIPLELSFNTIKRIL